MEAGSEKAPEVRDQEAGFAPSPSMGEGLSEQKGVREERWFGGHGRESLRGKKSSRGARGPSGSGDVETEGKDGTLRTFGRREERA